MLNRGDRVSGLRMQGTPALRAASLASVSQGVTGGKHCRAGPHPQGGGRPDEEPAFFGFWVSPPL